jgi:hypothetical protein
MRSTFHWANMSAAICWLIALQGVLAYVVVRPCLAAIQVLCMLTKSWGEDEFTFRKGWLWCMLTNNAMQVRMPAVMYSSSDNACCACESVHVEKPLMTACIVRHAGVGSVLPCVHVQSYLQRAC